MDIKKKRARFEFRLSEELKQHAKATAKERGLSLSELLNDFLKQLITAKGQ